jgi:predicted NAD/FAD-binding protein
MPRKRSKVAVVGTGISGLVAAHKLHPAHDITVFEAGDHVGGHTNTVHVENANDDVWVDTGFIVHNDRNYPHFQALMTELGVETQPSHMSFSVSDDRGSFEYAGTPRGLLAQPAHLVSPRFLRMLSDLRRFNREARDLIGLPPGRGPSLREFLREGRYSEWFIERLIVPQASAVWSADPEQLWEFPASFLAQFFANHGMLGLRDRPQWRTVTGGSRRYVEEIVRPFADRIRLGTSVLSVTRAVDHVEVTATGCEPEHFDEVVIATHADQALWMLRDKTPAELEILGAFPYQHNEAVLHTDRSLLPRRRSAWASWNYHLTPAAPEATQLTYWMNNLQSLESDTDYLVTLNRRGHVDPRAVIRTIAYEHPVFTAEGYAAQARHAEISGGRTHFCGAYWGWGFHEDGVASALAALELREAAPQHATRGLAA